MTTQNADEEVKSAIFMKLASQQMHRPLHLNAACLTAPEELKDEIESFALAVEPTDTDTFAPMDIGAKSKG